MIKVRLPDGKQIEVKKGSTPLEIAKHVGRKLAEDAIVAKINNKLTDLAEPLESDCTLQILTFKDREGKEVYWHSASHLMAQAVKRLFKDGVKLTLGPPIEEGFYYDMDKDAPFTPEDIAAIEKEMERIVKEDIRAEHIWMGRKEAIEHYKKEGNSYKLEIIAEIPEGKISFYRQAEFIDMCRGPHVPSTGYFKAFKLTEIAGAYWRGDSKNAMLQRIYGVAYPEKKMLADYLHRMEEAKKRDHRRLGKDLDLFSFHEEAGPGLVYWHPKGGRVRSIIEDFWRQEHLRGGYEIVYSPHMGMSWLWKTSGHLQNYNDYMYSPMKVDNNDYYIKPMNCPFHIMMYKNARRSYRELPMRWAELGTVYRYEKGGVLHGLLRVRGFTQDDAHIFCTPEQMEGEILEVLRFSLRMLRAFGFADIKAYLATRPKDAVGEQSHWEMAIAALKAAVEKEGLPYGIDEGGGVFYGPKIDLKVKDALGREWQLTTIQFDFNLPERFDLKYAGADGREHRPYMVHRALLGSLERFMGVLLEHYGGAFPVWLAPVQVALLPVNDGHMPFAKQLAAKMRKGGLRVEVDEKASTINYKIRDAQLQKIPYMLVIGDKEKESGTLQVRTRKGDISNEPVDAFIARVEKEIAEKA